MKQFNRIERDVARVTIETIPLSRYNWAVTRRHVFVRCCELTASKL